MESIPSALGTGSLNHWPRREVLACICSSLSVLSFCVLKPLRTWCSLLMLILEKLQAELGLALVIVCRASNQRKPNSSFSSYWLQHNCRRASQVALGVKNPPTSAGGVGKSPWSRQRQPTPVFLPGKSHGQRSLAGYSPWDRKESERT